MRYNNKKKQSPPPPIPWVVSFEMCFIDDDLSEEQYIKEVKKIIRRWKANGQPQTDEEGGLFDSYDERVSEIIQEVLAEN